jgi:tetratricopeptide (TPR) repeat protein
VRTLEGLPALAEAQFYMGLNYRMLRDHASAQRCLAEAWELGFRDPYALYALIEEDHALGDKAAGLRHFQAFATQFPDSPWLHVLYANAYFLKDRGGREEGISRSAADPQLPGVNFRLGT